MKKKEKYKKICLGISIIILVLIITYVVGKPIISLLSDTERFKETIRGYGLLGELFFLFLTIIQVVLALIPSEALELAGGYAFGFVESTILCLVGVSVGSAVVIYLTQKFGKKFVNLFYSDEKLDKIKLFKNEKKLGALIFLLFLIPGTPKDLITYTVGLTSLKISTYLLLTSIARTPSIIISTLAGSMLADNNYDMALLFFGLSVVTGIIGFLVYKFYFEKKEHQSDVFSF